MKTLSPKHVDRTLLKTEMLIQLWQHGWVTPMQWERSVFDALVLDGACDEIVAETVQEPNFAELMNELCEHGYARTTELGGIDVVVAADPDLVELNH